MKVLLLDTAFAAFPIYDALVAAGHDVWVMGNRPDDLLARRAGASWIRQDYSDVPSVEAHVRAGGFERVVPGCTDVSITTCAALGIMQGHMDPAEVNATLGDKSRFRARGARVGMRAPQVVAPGALPPRGRFICKPVDAFSGRGISIFEAAEPGAAEKALSVARQASPSGTALIETFVQGPLYSCSGFLEAGRLIDTTYVIEGSSANPFAVDTSYVVTTIPAAMRVELEQSLERLAVELVLADGLLHTQFILSDEGAHVVEVSRRCPGDLYALLIEYATGYPYAARYAASFLGERITRSTPPRPRQILRHTVAADRQGVYSGLRLNRPLPVIAFFPLAAMGETLLARQGKRAGVLFCEAADATALTVMYRDFLDRNTYVIG